MTFKELRERQGFESGARLAKLANIEQTTVSQLDAGKIADPRYSTVEAIAEVLGLTVGAVMKAIRQTSRAA